MYLSETVVTARFVANITFLLPGWHLTASYSKTVGLLYQAYIHYRMAAWVCIMHIKDSLYSEYILIILLGHTYELGPVLQIFARVIKAVFVACKCREMCRVDCTLL